LKDLYNDNFSPGSLNHHYTSMAKRVWHEHLQGDNIEAKKYLYCARALLASEWLKTEQTFPSLSFDTLVESSSVNKLVKQELLEITNHKKYAQEKSLVGRSIILDDFIKERLSEESPSNTHWLRGSSALSIDRLNCIFRDILAQVNGR
jgi:predicted nucleotidyltransferase